MENAALIFRVQAAEEKVDVLEGKIEEKEKSLGRLQTELHRRRRSRRHSPIVTIGLGSSEDPLEIVSEVDRQLTLRQRACRTRRAVEVLDKAVQVPDVEEEEGEGSDSSGLSYCTVPVTTPASPSPVVSHDSDQENATPVPIPPPQWENEAQRQQVLDEVDRRHAMDRAEFEYETLISRGMSFRRDQLTDCLIPCEE